MSTPENFRNLRDMGGLSCGKKAIKSGKIFRSPKLFAESDGDKAFVASLCVDTVIDLRCWEEQNEKPDFVPSGCRYISAPVFESKKYPYIVVTNVAKLRVAMLRGKRKALLKKNKLDSYREMAFSPAFSEIFGAMDRGESFVFHCTEGKDRTGVAAALIEYVLGRDEDEIRSQYLLSNSLRPEKDRSKMRKFGISQSLIDDIKYCESVHDELFDITKNEILKIYGTVDKYLLECFGVSEERKAVWRKEYLA